MGSYLFLEKIQNLWKTWDVRGFVLFSLMLQTILIFLAPLRKRMPHKRLNMCIWFAYLLADWVSSFALGLISKSQRDKSPSHPKEPHHLALWAPFLLLHLGGPDTITAFSLEDNELWLRHLLSLLLQLSAAIYIFIQSLPHNIFLAPTCLMFVVGLIKYGERNRALYLASMNSFRSSMLGEPDPGPNYAKLMAEYWWKKECELPTRISMMNEPETNAERYDDREEGTANNPTEDPDEIVIVHKAYVFFNTFKGLIVDLIFSFNDREESRKFFLGIKKAEKAFEVIEIELSFIYDLLYTKASIIHSIPGYVLRVTCFISTFIAFFLFAFNQKGKMTPIEVKVTFALFIGAISLDTIALLMLVFSNWTIALINKSNPNSVKSFVSGFLTTNIFFNKSRWSASVSQYNLINFCLSKRRKWVDKFVCLFGLKEFLDEIQYKSRNPLSPAPNSKARYDLKEFIFQELKHKSEQAIDLKITKQICSSRGDYVLRNYAHIRHKLTWSFKVEYDESVLLWHVATDLLYHKEPENKEENRELCKVISDYLLYLLVIQPNVISPVASIAQIRYRDTCAEAEKVFGSLASESSVPKSVLKIICGFRLEANEEKLRKACDKLLDLKIAVSAVKPSYVKGDRSKSVLFDAVRLAGNLQDLNNEKWEIMSKVWLELLCYAASHCRANTHAQQVSRGGELITLVWLLMVHFGLGEQFRIVAGHARAKLIVEK